MPQVKANSTLEQDIWQKFGRVVPNRKESRIINELIKQEVHKRNKIRKGKERGQAFRNASRDKGRTKEMSA